MDIDQLRKNIVATENEMEMLRTKMTSDDQLDRMDVGMYLYNQDIHRTLSEWLAQEEAKNRPFWKKIFKK